jgi:hypothetical protein
MKFEDVKAVVTSKTARQILLTRKHSPKILFVAGTIGVVGTVVLACRATLKVGEVLDQHEIDVKLVKGEFPATQQASEDVDADVRKLKVRAAITIVKPYLPAVGLGIASIGALTGSHVILTKRNGTLVAGLAAVDQAFKEYRSRVTDEYGESVDHKFATGKETVAVEEKLADGTTTISTKDVKTGKFGGSPYAVVFDERSKKFSKAPGANAATVAMINTFADHKLKAQGHLFLNEVLDMLDLPRTSLGQIVGWVYDMKTPDHPGDNYVDFGVFTGDRELTEDFINGDYYYVTLDFNVDGRIFDLI